MKVYIGNLDGLRRGLVIASSWKQVSEIVGTTVGDLRNYWVSNPMPPPVDWMEPGRLYTQPFGTTKESEWVEGKCAVESRNVGVLK